MSEIAGRTRLEETDVKEVLLVKFGSERDKMVRAYSLLAVLPLVEFVWMIFEPGARVPYRFLFDLLLLLVFGGAAWATYTRLPKEAARAVHRPRGESAFRIAPEGVHAQDDFGSTFSRWSTFTHVRETPTLFLFDNQGGNEYVFIPKRSLAGPRDVDGVRRLAQDAGLRPLRGP